jgi:hypothetical protein
MKKKRFSEEQILAVVEQAETRWDHFLTVFNLHRNQASDRRVVQPPKTKPPAFPLRTGPVIIRQICE